MGFGMDALKKGFKGLLDMGSMLLNKGTDVIIGLLVLGVSFGVVGVKAYSLIVILYTAPKLTEKVIAKTPIVESLGKFRIKTDGLVIIFDSLGELTELVVTQATVAVSFGKFRIKTDGFT